MHHNCTSRRTVWVGVKEVSMWLMSTWPVARNGASRSVASVKASLAERCDFASPLCPYIPITRPPACQTVYTVHGVASFDRLSFLVGLLWLFSALDSSLLLFCGVAACQFGQDGPTGSALSITCEFSDHGSYLLPVDFLCHSEPVCNRPRCAEHVTVTLRIAAPDSSKVSSGATAT